MNIWDVNHKIDPAINRLVRGYVKRGCSANPDEDWREMSDEDFWFHYCCCAFSIGGENYQTVYSRVCLLKERGLLADIHEKYGDSASYKQAVHEVLKDRSSGLNRARRHEQHANRLARSVFSMKAAGSSFREILEHHASDLQFARQDWSSARSVREKLVDETSELLPFQLLGFGPKSTSMFLRDIGYNFDIAILDEVHVVNKYMKQVREIAPSMMEIDPGEVYPSYLVDYTMRKGKDRGLTRIGYESLEREFQNLAKQMDVSAKYLDEAVWTVFNARSKGTDPCP